MPYDTPYNRMIADRLDFINRQFVVHNDMTGQGPGIDYRNSANIDVDGNGLLSSKHFTGGGSGMAEFKKGNASKHYNDEGYQSDESECCEGCEAGGECEGGAPMRTMDVKPEDIEKAKEIARRKNQKGNTVGYRPDFNRPVDYNKPKPVKVDGDTIGYVDPQIKRPQVVNKKTVEAKLMEGGAILGFQENTVLGRKNKKPVLKKPDVSFGSLGVPSRPVAEVVVNSANKVLSVPQAMTMLDRDRPMRGMGRKKKANEEVKEEPKKKGGRKKKVGGAEARAIGGSPLESIPDALVKKTVKATRGKNTKVVPKEQMTGSTMSGMGKKSAKARAEIVKKVMKEKGLKMIEASKYVKAHGLY